MIYITSLHYKYIFILVFFLSGISCYSQAEGKQREKIDSLISVAKQYNKRYNTTALVKTAELLLTKSEEYNDEKGLVFANYYLACSLSNVQQYKKSTFYINEALSYNDYLEKDVVQKARTILLLANNYRDLQIYSLSISQYFESQKIIAKSPATDQEAKLLKSSILINLSAYYYSVDKLDSVYYYLKKNAAALKNIDIADIYIDKSANDRQLGLYFIGKDNADSADYYISRGLSQLKSDNDPGKTGMLMGKGIVAEMKNNDPEAIAQYENAIKIAGPTGLSEYENVIYKYLGEIYTKQKNYKQATYYNDLYIKSTLKFTNQGATDRNFVLAAIAKGEKDAAAKLSQKNQIIYLSIGVLLIVVISIGFFAYRKNKRNTMQTSLITSKLLSEKETIILQQNEHTELLQQKVNDCFDEVILLAKENRPEFFSRFQEVYPTFIEKILEINPKMRTSELAFCAYVFLGFNTKDIAQYTFKSIHTIHGKKSSFRKKFNIGPEEDLELYLKKMVQV